MFEKSSFKKLLNLVKKNNKKLNYIDLHLSYTQATRLFKALKSNNRVVSLRATLKPDNSKVIEADPQAVTDSLVKQLEALTLTNHHIKSLSLATDYNNLIVDNLCKALKANTTIKHLTLEQLDSRIIDCIADMLPQNNSLETLELSFIQLPPQVKSDHYEKFFANLLKNKTLRHLSLTSIRGHTHKTYAFSDNDTLKIKQLIAQNKLVSFAINHRIIKIDTLREIITAVSQNNTLKCFSASISSHHIKDISELISRNTQLEQLITTSYADDIWVNNYFEFDSFLANLSTNTTLKQIGIPFPENDEAYLKLCDMLKENHTLEHVSLFNNYMLTSPSNFIKTLIEVLQTNTSLYNIELSTLNSWDNSYSINLYVKKNPHLALLLRRNYYLHEIQANPKALKCVLNKANLAALDDRFFVSLFKKVPAALASESSELIAHYMRKRKANSIFKKIKFYLGLDTYSEGINSVLNLLDNEAQAGDSHSQMVLGQIHSRLLFQQPLNIMKATEYFSLTAQQPEPIIAAQANFELGNLKLNYERDSSIAIEHFDAAAENIGKDAVLLRDYCLQELQQKNGLMLEKVQSEKALEEFKNETEAFSDPVKFLSQFPRNTIKLHKQQFAETHEATLIYRALRWKKAQKEIAIQEQRYQCLAAAEARKSIQQIC